MKIRLPKFNRYKHNKIIGKQLQQEFMALSEETLGHKYAYRKMLRDGELVVKSYKGSRAVFKEHYTPDTLMKYMKDLKETKENKKENKNEKL